MVEKFSEMNFHSFDKLKDKYIGEVGTASREQYEFELRLDILREMKDNASKIKVEQLLKN